MNIEEAAAALQNCEYGEEAQPEFWQKLREHRLVAVFGASDDLTEFRGAINDEVGVGKIYLDKDNIIHDIDQPWPPKSSRFIEVITGQQIDCVFEYKTNINHLVFDVLEYGKLYCRGIVFSLDDL